jgi:hypothetical protein
MALTKNEIRKRLTGFAKLQKGAKSERGQSQAFWLRFYECFGIRAESATIYEQAVKKLSGAPGFIDSFIPGKLIVEHKSAGRDLDKAFDQASDYFLALKEGERPRYIITSDFARIRVYDLATGGGYRQCKLAELSKKADWFMFLVDGEVVDVTEESEADRTAAYTISKLHEALLRQNFKGRALEVFLTRLLFCLFADDTNIFGDNGMFLKLLRATKSDGGDVGRTLSEFFQVLNTPFEDRQSNLDEALMQFAYVNGRLFEENTRIPSFDTDLRGVLLECAALGWSSISPAIFGAMFQGVLEEHNPNGADSSNRKASRREFGAHYTSERNILRVINPLFMDDLRAELEKVKKNKKLLQAFYEKLPSLTFFDPACGCGNFLVISFRELRQIEMDTIEAMSDAGLTNAGSGGLLDISTLCRVKVSQFYGIEIDESAVHIARVAMWITDHQLNTEAASRFGETRPSVPLIDSATIYHGNSLRTAWEDVLAATNCSFVLGNPPFIGHQYRTEEQVADMDLIWGNDGRFGRLDYVTCWHKKAVAYMKENTNIETALVSTNSICQGEQVGILWSYLLSQGVEIRFAHRTFQWRNEGKGVAAVHCVIVGLTLSNPSKRTIYDYEFNIKGEPVLIPAKTINPYLIDAANILLPSRNSAPPGMPQMLKGSQPTDGGHLVLTQEAKDALIDIEPDCEKWLLPYIGSEELINGNGRWCLWLKGIAPKALKAMPSVYARVKRVTEARLASPTASVRDFAHKPSLFTQDRQPNIDYLAVPEVSSENRRFIPIGFLSQEVIASNKLQIIPGGTMYHFGVLCSTMHNAWMRVVAGRLNSRYSYAPAVYNNFPWPDVVDPNDENSIVIAGNLVLKARAKHRSSTLAELYDPTAMPPELMEAHKKLDRAVDAMFAYKGSKDDPSRVAFLFSMYQTKTSLLPAITKKKTKAKVTV